ncbi:nodulation protein NfeD [Mangrovimicrobium sediminis]|uniref:Nodulation protein NfeD n=2 Tax=Mangrovimicrobium sediminis TaxID=2562682 RepID=A0A4Z0M230_9GAMM|nr:nodulation protein NfeD [Haliea sp. SAOS-164]
MRQILTTITGFLASLLLAVSSASAHAEVWQVDVAGPIGPALADHTVRALAAADAAGAQLVLLRIDTPGGLDGAMRDIIKAILAAPLPVVGYVAPSGSRAASAGTYILYATHVAAMAPGTNLGAATPVQIASPGLPGGANEDGDAGAAGHGSAMERKLVNDAVAYIRSLAQLRGRNGDWAEAAVREGTSLSAEDALDQGVIDVLAASRDELLDALDGREVSVNDTAHTLRTVGAPVHLQAMDWRSRFLAVITNPNVAYLLMLVGFYGLVLEFYNPGVGVPGIAGAVCLLLALYAFQVLPVSYVALGLIALGVGLMVAEANVPSFGVLGIGGVVAFVFGSIMLMDTELPAYQIALPLIAGVALFSVALFTFALGMLLKSRRGPPVSGVQPLLGHAAQVEVVRGGTPYVRLDGELWQAHSAQPLAPHDRVIVDAVDGLVLKVSKSREESES